MASRQPDSVCLICDPNPCQCFAKPKRARVVKREKVPPIIDVPLPDKAPPPLPVQRRPSALDAMRAAATQAKLEQKAEPAPQPKGKFELGEDDALTLQALRNLSVHFDISGPDVDKYRSYLDKPATVAERATAWKARRR